MRLFLIIWIIIISGCNKYNLLPQNIDGDYYIFKYFDKKAKSVSLVGSFNGWDRDGFEMVKTKEGLWEIKLKLKSGIYFYMFLIDGVRFESPQEAELYVEDMFGNKNGVIEIK